MSFESAGYQLLPVLPELVLAAGAMVLLMIGAYRGTQTTSLVTGLAILVVHLAFYPWPDITHESASFAGLTAQKARDKAEREVRRVRGSLPQLEYSTQSRAVSDGHDVWLVYFRTASGGSSACAATLTRDSVDTTEACSK